MCYLQRTLVGRTFERDLFELHVATDADYFWRGYLVNFLYFILN